MDEFPNSFRNKQKIPSIKRKTPKDDIFENELLSNGLLLGKKERTAKNIIKNKNILKDSSSRYSLMLSSEIESIKRKKMKKEVEKRYIVDDIDDILILLKEPKLRFKIQEILQYFIVFIVGIYYWIFLFLTGIQFERNYYFTDQEQFDVVIDEQVCDYPENSANIIIYNKSLKYNNISSDVNEFFTEECDRVNYFYKDYFIRYFYLINENKLTATRQPNYVTDKPMLSIVIMNKENWKIYLRYFSICEMEMYYFAMVIVVSIGGLLGAIFIGFLSDLYGRKIIIIITLSISTIGTFGIYLLSLYLDVFYENELQFFKEKCLKKGIIYSLDILPELYAQKQIKYKFSNLYSYYLLCIFLISFAIWPLLKSCLALLTEHSKGELEVLITLRKFNFILHGLPPLSTSLLFINLNDFTLTFLILSIINLSTLIFSFIFLDESIRYYYEYCEWENLTKVIFNTHKINLKEFKTLNEEEFKDYKQKEKHKIFNKNDFIYNSFSNNSHYIIDQTYYSNCKNACNSLSRSIKRKIDFVIKLDDVKSYPFLIIISLWANNIIKNSIILLLIIMSSLHIVLALFHKELLEPPFFSVKDLYFGKQFNYIFNSTLFYYLVTNFFSNYFYYFFYRINCFKTIIYFSQIIISLTLLLYHFIITNVPRTPMNMNQYNLGMLVYFLRDIRPILNLILLMIVYFAFNGVTFYAHLLIVKISKTIYRCTFFSLQSISFIIAIVISELIYYHMENYFLFLSVVNLLCLLMFFFLSEIKGVNYLMNDLKVNDFGIRKNNWREKFKAI